MRPVIITTAATVAAEDLTVLEAVGLRAELRLSLSVRASTTDLMIEDVMVVMIVDATILDPCVTETPEEVNHIVFQYFFCNINFLL